MSYTRTNRCMERGVSHESFLHDEETGEDKFLIEQWNWQGAGIYELIAEGILGKPAVRIPVKEE
jgi:hypothetical protein